MTMTRLEYGVKRAISEIVSGIVISSLLNSFSHSGLLDPSHVILFNILNILGVVALTFAMPYWGSSYLIGWLIGLLIMSQTGLIELWEFLAYFAAALFVFITRIWKQLKS